MKKLITTLLISFFLPFVTSAAYITVPQSTAFGQVLIGNAVGGNYTPVATSTLGITGGGGGSSGGTWSTTTSSVAGYLINYSNNNTDIVTVGGNSTSTASFIFDPNSLIAAFASGVKVGIGTLSPTNALTVIGNASTTQLTTTGSTYLATTGGNVGINTTAPSNLLTIKGNSTTDSAPISGGELSVPANFTWAYYPNDQWYASSTAGAFVHIASTTASALTQTIALTKGQAYQVSFQLSATTTAVGNFTVALGYATSTQTFVCTQLPTTYTYGPTALQTTGDLTFTPSATSNCNIANVSVKTISTGSAVFALMDSTGAVGTEIRQTLSSLKNTYIGFGSGSHNTTGTYNTANGYQSLFSNTTGYQNTANGYASLYSNTTGYYNTANGYYSLYSNTTGAYNTANGYQSLYYNTTGAYNTANGYASLYSNTTGYYNTANGYYSLYSNTTGIDNTAQGYNALTNNTTGTDNTAQGYNALRYNTTGTNNTAFGYSAGRYYNGTTGNLTAINNSLFLGAGTSALNATGDTNETVIGYNAVGNGSNTMTLGGTGTTGTIIPYGYVGIGTTTPSQTLDVNGNVNIENANGILLKDTVTGTCSIINLTSGVLVATTHACK